MRWRGRPSEPPEQPRDHLVLLGFREPFDLRACLETVGGDTAAPLVVDEVGYLTYGTDAANMLFHVVNDRHRRKRSMIFTTNKTPAAWGRVLHDEDLAQAIIDRVPERGRLLRSTDSMRTKHLEASRP